MKWLRCPVCWECPTRDFAPYCIGIWVAVLILAAALLLGCPADATAPEVWNADVAKATYERKQLEIMEKELLLMERQTVALERAAECR